MASSLTVYPIPAFTDNYIWCIHDGCHAVVVDPGDASPVFESLAAHQLRLDAILITHHHADHTGGIRELVERYPGLSVYGPDNPKIRGITHTLREGDTCCVGNFELSLDVLEVPGHTLDHIAFYNDDFLFCGDTLFSAGCGRLFEGTPKQMLKSLNKLAALPDSLPVYCTHEYTMANLRFAKAVEPTNEDIKDKIESVQHLRDANLPSLPTSLAIEKTINPFLRAHREDSWPHIEAQTGKTIRDTEQAFAAVRAWKDNF